MMNRLNTKSLTLLCLVCFGITGCEPEDSGIGKVEFVEDTKLGPTSSRVMKAIKTEEDKTPVISKSGPWPKLEAKQTVHQFGRMALGTSGKHTYVVTNVGDADLELVAGRPTCNCTQFSVSRQFVKPGESAEVYLHWTTKEASKRYQHSGPLLTNDPENPKQAFSIQGIVDESIKIMPALQWEIGEVDSHVEGRFTAMVGSAINKGFTIDNLQSESEHLSFDTEPLSPKELTEMGLLTGYRVNVTLAKNAPAGLLDTTVTMKVSCEKQPSQMKLTAMKSGPISVIDVTDGGLWLKSLGGIRLGRFKARDGRKVSLLFAVSTDLMPDELKLSDVKTSPSWIKWDLESVPSRSEAVKRYRLNLEIPPGSPRVKRSNNDPASIDMKTNIPAQPNWKVMLGYTSF